HQHALHRWQYRKTDRKSLIGFGSLTYDNRDSIIRRTTSGVAATVHQLFNFRFARHPDTISPARMTFQVTRRDNVGSLPPMRLSLTVPSSQNAICCNEWRCSVSKTSRTRCREETSHVLQHIDLADPQS